MATDDHFLYLRTPGHNGQGGKRPGGTFSLTVRQLLLAVMFAAAALTLLSAAATSANAAQLEPGLHGTDTPQDIGFDLTQAVAQQEMLDMPGTSMSAGGLPVTWCGTERTTDNTTNAAYAASLPQFKVIYAYPADQPNRFAQWSELLQANTSLITSFVSSQNGSSKAPRFDMGTECGAEYVDIQVVRLPSGRSSYVQNFNAVKSHVLSQVNPSPGGIRNYMIVGDTLSSGSINAQGELYASATANTAANRPDSSNIHNNGGLTSILWVPNTALPSGGANPGWYPTVQLHEMTHNMGAVQWNAPHTTQPTNANNYLYSHCWDGYDVMCYQDGPAPKHTYVTTSCAALTGAMTQTYDCGQDDYFNPAPAPGSYLATSWNVYNSVFLAECNTLPAGACVNSTPTGPPANTGIPTVSGTAGRARTLSANVGTWDPAGSNYTYQWQRNTGSGWANITGATTRTYTIPATDVAAYLRVQVTAINSLGSAQAASAQVGPVTTSPPTNDVAPTVSGTAKRLEKLTAAPGTWSPNVTSYKYQWQRCDSAGANCVNITGAAASTYTLAALDVGKTVRVQVTAVNADGSGAASSAPTGVVAPTPPTNTIVPVITGTLKRALTASASAGAWTPAGSTFAYQWQRCDSAGANCADIAGATKATYVMVTADVNNKLKVRVTATNSDGSASATSVASAAVLPAPPVASAAPVVSGTKATGAVLTSSTGTWTPAGSTFTYQWQRNTGSSWADIAGATASTYTLTPDDAAATIRVRVTAANEDGSATNFSAATTAIMPTPTATQAPQISGTLQNESTITTTNGTWWPSAGTFTYKYTWLRCPVGATQVTSTCATAATTTVPSYKLTVSDIGRPMAVRVSATQNNVTGTGASAVTAPVEGRPLTVVAAPAISQTTGLTQVQEPLTATAGTWSVTPSTVKYQWLRCDAAGENCANITNAVSVSYTPAAADANLKLRVRVTVTSPGRTATADSAATASVTPLPAPSSTGAPTVSGSAVRRQLIKATTGTWAGRPASYKYQWQRCDSAGANCADITSATASSYTLAAADVGSTVRVQVTAVNAAGTGSAVSAVTAVVAADPPVNTAAPTVSGTAQVGKTLASAKGTWTGGSDTVFTYQWQRCDSAGANCANITTATSSSYTPVDADVASKLRVRVTGTNPDGTVAVFSAVTGAVIPAAPKATVLPKITGTATVGQTLTGVTGTWVNPVTTKQMQFFRCSTSTSCTAVTALGVTSYTLTSLDAGKRIKLTEIATGPGGTTTAVASLMAGPVASATTGSELITAGSSATVQTSTGQTVATVTSSTTQAASAKVTRTAGGPQTVIKVRQSKKVKGKWRAWVCPVKVADDGQVSACTKPVKLRAGKKMRLAPVAGRKVHVVVSRAAKR